MKSSSIGYLWKITIIGERPNMNGNACLGVDSYLHQWPQMDQDSRERRNYKYKRNRNWNYEWTLRLPLKSLFLWYNFSQYRILSHRYRKGLISSGGTSYWRICHEQCLDNIEGFGVHIHS